MSSQLRAVMSTLLILHTTESAATVILFTRVMKSLLPANRPNMVRLSNPSSSDQWEATTAANASADGPLAVSVAARADDELAACPIVQQSTAANMLILRIVVLLLKPIPLTAHAVAPATLARVVSWECRVFGI